MKIILDARTVTQKINGLGNYAIFLINNLAKIDTENQYVILKRKGANVSFVKQDNFSEVEAKFDIASPGNLFSHQPLINDLQGDIYHSLFHAYPAGLKNIKKVMTIHDLMWMENIDILFTGNIKNRLKVLSMGLYGNTLMKRAIETSHKIIAISNHTQDRILHHCNIDPKNIAMIYHGVDPLPEAETVDLPSEIQKFALILGNTRAQKNIPRLLQAFAKVAHQHDTYFVVAGRGDQRALLEKLCKSYGIERKVFFSGKATNGQLRWLYENASFLAFPSVVEGFGLPQIEAMYYDLPILTSNRPPMSEISENCAHFIDPEDVDDMAKGLEKMITDDTYRAQLAQKGKARAPIFDWVETAKKTLAVYKSLENA